MNLIRQYNAAVLPNSISTWDSYLKCIAQTSNCLAIVLHGSLVKNTMDQFSDIDVIHVVDNDCHQHEIVKLKDGTLDIYKTSMKELEGRCFEEHQDNSNFVIKAMVEGKILYQRDRCLDALVSKCIDHWNSGPALPSEKEKSYIRLHVLKMLANASKILNRAGSDPFGQSLAQIRICQVFVRFIYKYQRCMGYWASDIHEMMNQMAMKQPALYVLCRRFIDEHSPSERLDVLRICPETREGIREVIGVGRFCCIGWSHVPERSDRCAVEEAGAVAERAADWTTCWRAASEV